MKCENSNAYGIDSTAKLLEDVCAMYLNSNYCDITFTVEGTKLPAHKSILAARSPYFRALLFGCSGPSKSDIELTVPLEAFKCVLEYLYTGRVGLSKMEHLLMLQVLGVAHDIGIDEIKSGISAYSMNNLSLQNCCSILDVACSYDLKLLTEATLIFIDKNASRVLDSNEFKSLSQSSLNSLLERDSFFAREIDIVKAVLEWRKHNQKVDGSDFQTIISHIRFNLIDLEDIV